VKNIAIDIIISFSSSFQFFEYKFTWRFNNKVALLILGVYVLKLFSLWRIFPFDISNLAANDQLSLASGE
jgi:hypothetical protein